MDDFDPAGQAVRCNCSGNHCPRRRRKCDQRADQAYIDRDIQKDVILPADHDTIHVSGLYGRFQLCNDVINRNLILFLFFPGRILFFRFPAAACV